MWQLAHDSAPEEFGDDALAAASEPVADSEAPVEGSGKLVATSIEDKVRFFEREFEDDIRLPESEWALMQSVLLRLERVQKVVGHGNFNVLAFDDALKFAKRYNSVGEFTKRELDFIEKVFFTEAADYGFLGEKVSHQLTDRIAKADTYKVPYSGHFLFRGDSLAYYDKLKKDIGSNIILTSGIRSNVKQMHLFLAKAAASNYNLSKASRSLAPPGHSFHGIGDFDVGRVGWGARNFTDQFAETDEFKRMQDLGYVQIRYTQDNQLGVRFEPWHIKVV
ncbi:MAG: M15 family metallopeptidase [Candidatus Pelagadaptatus aseana]|uniref:M15 family metallopeptidase n=1 Tax=Candidatus Pelagadaptatus aseana TaxID=3120508 RepID=UPI0039B20CBB